MHCVNMGRPAAHCGPSVLPEHSPSAIHEPHAALQMAEGKAFCNILRLHSARFEVLNLALEPYMIESGLLRHHAAQTRQDIFKHGKSTC